MSASPEQQQKLFSNLDHNAARRIRPGTKAEDMAEGPPLVDLSEVRNPSSDTRAVILTMNVDRLSFPAHRTPQSTTQLSDTSNRLEWHNRGGQRHGTAAGTTARERRQDTLALRAMPVPHSKSQLDHRGTLLRRPAMFLHHLPRDARFRMAIPLRSTRPAQVMWRH
jgi:hypothetical protein